MTDSRPAARRISQTQFTFLANYLSSKYGLNVPVEKKILMESRLMSRLNYHKMESVEEYIDFVLKSKDGREDYEIFV